MNEQERKWAKYGGGTLIIGIGLAYFTGYLDWNTIQYLILLTGVGSAGYYLYGDRVHETVKDQLSNEGEGKDGRFTEPELRNKIVEWSKSNLGTDDYIITFDDSDYTADSIPLKWDDDDDEELWAFFTNFGPNNQGILVFIEAYTGEIKGKALQRRLDVGKNVMRFDPFRFSNYYQEYDRNREQRTRRYQYRRSTGSDDDDDGGMEVKPD